VLHLIKHPRREMWIGWPTIKAIIGQRLIPGYLDHYLAKHAYADQVTNDLPPTWLDNVDAPLPGDRGAHGDFDNRSRSTSAQVWLTTHRGAVAAAALGLLGAVLLARRGQ
jgi:hypothetical protein